MDKLTNVHGGWVVADRFWDREPELQSLIERLDEGAHILLVAQRRMGKTSLMREVAERLAERYICLFVDLQKARSAPDAVVELSVATYPHKNIWGKTKQAFANVLGRAVETVEKVEVAELGIALRPGVTGGDWGKRADELMAILAGSEKPVLLLLDEVPILVNRMLKGDDFAVTAERRATADEFMSWLRKTSIEYQGRIRMVVSGSIGFEPILRQAGLSATINNFTPFELKPWDSATAEGCLLALANEYGLEFEDGVASRMVRHLGCCIPHHVQMFFSHVRDHCRRKGVAKCTAKDAGEVYKKEMLGVRGHAELTHYEERLKQVLGEEACALALEMLTEAAVEKRMTPEAYRAFEKEYSFEGRSTAKMQEEILWVLEHDGYLKPGRKGYVFVSKLLRDWWKARHGFGYVPVLKRGV